MKIAIQGIKASFHDMAVRKYFETEEVQLIECRSFEMLCKKVARNEADMGMMAIENTFAGSFLPNYSFLAKYSLHVIGEEYLHIKQNLMALPGQKIKDIEQVRSHPIALLQCSDFIEYHSHMRALETYDTAGSAREIKDQNLSGVAAIASDLAAAEYGLEVLAEEIENLKQNSTRFVVVSATNQYVPDADKASISFQLQSKVGSLTDVLTAFRYHNINLTKIQSVPIPGKPFQYIFHIDVEWEERENLGQALRAIDKLNLTEKVEIFGEYKKGDKEAIFANDNIMKSSI